VDGRWRGVETVKVAFAGIVFNGDHFLEPVIKQVRPFASSICFAEGPTEYYQKLGYTHSTDKTLEILYDLIGKENVVSGVWKEKDEEAAATERLIPADSDYVFWIDSDEGYSHSDLEKIFALLESNQYDSMAFTADSFFGSFDHVVMGWERAFEVHRIMRWKENPHWITHRPPTVNAPDGKPWREHRHLSHGDTEKLGITLKHYSYVYPSQVIAKAGYYDAYEQGLCIPNYVNRVFLPWVKGTQEERNKIEAEFRGVHNFNYGRRGETYTARFTGKHPEQIELVLPELKQRFQDELEQFKC